MRLLNRGIATGLLLTTIVAGCASLPPGSSFPKKPSAAFAHPEETRVGKIFEDQARVHPDGSAFRILPVGADGFAARMQMIKAAQRTLDVQYYIFTADSTGLLVTDALLAAADRGLHVRILIDDGETIAGDEQILVLAAHPQIEVRIFNPFTYRGHLRLVRNIEFLLEARRLDYRMHNKLFVADNATALIGGRNIGDAYFQIDPDAQYADDDVFVGGPLVRKLSGTFDEYWNYAQFVTGWTNAMLQPPPPHVLNILVAAQSKPKVGKAFVNGFDDPRTFFPWLADPAEAEKFVQAA